MVIPSSTLVHTRLLDRTRATEGTTRLSRWRGRRSCPRSTRRADGHRSRAAAQPLHFGRARSARVRKGGERRRERVRARANEGNQRMCASSRRVRRRASQVRAAAPSCAHDDVEKRRASRAASSRSRAAFRIGTIRLVAIVRGDADRLRARGCEVKPSSSAMVSAKHAQKGSDSTLPQCPKSCTRRPSQDKMTLRKLLDPASRRITKRGSAMSRKSRPNLTWNSRR